MSANPAAALAQHDFNGLSPDDWLYAFANMILAGRQQGDLCSNDFDRADVERLRAIARALPAAVVLGGPQEPPPLEEETDDPRCRDGICVCDHCACDHADDSNVQPCCSECQCAEFRAAASAVHVAADSADWWTPLLAWLQDREDYYENHAAGAESTEATEVALVCDGRTAAYRDAAEHIRALFKTVAPPVPRPPQEDEAQRKFERSQQRWGNLKKRIEAEIVSFTNPCLSTQQRHQYQNGVARLRWVLDEMRKSPDVLAEAVPAAATPPVPAERLALDAIVSEMESEARQWRGHDTINNRVARQLETFSAKLRAVLVAAAPPAPGGDR